MIRLAKRWPDRTWAVQGAGGVGVQLAQRVVADEEKVLDVPPKLSTRARSFDVGHGRKTDPGDARTVAVVAIRTRGLRQVVPDDEMVALRLMSERRRDLVQSRTKTVNHLHQLLMELIPAGAHRNLTASKAKALLATIRPVLLQPRPAASSPSTCSMTSSHSTASSKTSTNASRPRSKRPAPA